MIFNFVLCHQLNKEHKSFVMMLWVEVHNQERFLKLYLNENCVFKGLSYKLSENKVNKEDSQQILELIA